MTSIKTRSFTKQGSLLRSTFSRDSWLLNHHRNVFALGRFRPPIPLTAPIFCWFSLRMAPFNQNFKRPSMVDPSRQCFMLNQLSLPAITLNVSHEESVLIETNCNCIIELLLFGLRLCVFLGRFAVGAESNVPLEASPSA